MAGVVNETAVRVRLFGSLSLDKTPGAAMVRVWFSSPCNCRGWQLGRMR